METPTVTQDHTYPGTRAFGHAASVRCLRVEAQEPITKGEAEAAALAHVRSNPHGTRWDPIVSSYAGGYSTVNVYCRRSC